MARKYIIDNTKNMTLKQCLRIRDNQYRNVDCTEDYCPFAIEQRIAELGTKQAERMVDNRHVGEFDEQLFALLPAGQQLLNLIDKAFINYKNNNCLFLSNNVPVHKQNKGVNMKMTLTQNDFVNLFDQYNRSENFSVAGRCALYDFFEEVNPNWECDVIAVCCDFTESTIEEALKNYDLESIEDLEDNTTVLRIDDETIIYQVY